ncbi:MAG TPA: bifunctional glutamine synthetase adenylyltransferase/deadenyltransferase, partial [Gammaproteobacteria bacterium]|nr:bifunctional glutamine synthetase adenylyltransferase/deadenyltransferase [Gammaproteobacteria bacterium]
ERYAMIKARVVAGQSAQSDELLKNLKPFIYRRYLDYGAFDALRELKRMISTEVKRKGLQDNIKLGPGGIREIEFIGQAFQLVRGGHEPQLQSRSIITTLNRLAESGHIHPDDSAKLIAAYDFLRRAENRLQMVDDQQTHDLPAD